LKNKTINIFLLEFHDEKQIIGFKKRYSLRYIHYLTNVFHKKFENFNVK